MSLSFRGVGEGEGDLVSLEFVTAFLRSIFLNVFFFCGCFFFVVVVVLFFVVVVVVFVLLF